MKTILYTKEFDEEINEDVNVILSPHFYWVKKINVKIKNLNTAKKVAKNLFDLDEREYFFDAYKIDNEYYAFAITKNLNLKIPQKFIKGIYLAQIELNEYECIKQGKFVIKKVEGIFFCFPNVDDECKEFKELKIEKLKHKINLDIINFDKKALIIIALFMVFLNGYFFIQTINFKSAINSIEEEKVTFLNKNNLPQTSFQLDSIYNNLIDKYVKQKRLKQDLEYISNTPVKKFTLLSYENSQFNIEINTSKNLDNYFSKHFKVISSSLNPYKVVLKDE